LTRPGLHLKWKNESLQQLEVTRYSSWEQERST